MIGWNSLRIDPKKITYVRDDISETATYGGDFTGKGLNTISKSMSTRGNYT